ncbi:MAG: right-handed parallel beta-helix repeat-containing protein [Methanobrevibacter sp.]|nr:right-handed parallel beta-helix repeat-containing protein [Methanobrevibacter sp.]
MINKTKKFILLGLTLSILVLAMVSAASATTYNFAPGASSALIQHIADTDCKDGDVINLNGTFNNISLNINKSLTINGVNDATLNGRNNADPIFNVTANNVTISNFILNGSGANGTLIIFTNVENAKVVGNIINSFGLDSTAIRLTSVQGATIEGNDLDGNNAGRDGIGVVNSSDITIDDNEISSFTRNGISLAAGFMGDNTTSTVDVLIQYNEFVDIGAECIFFGGGVSHVDILYNFFLDFKMNGINLARSASNVLIKGNEFDSTSNTSVAIRLEENNIFHNGTPTTLTNVVVINNSIFDAHIGILLYNVNNASNLETILEQDNQDNLATIPIKIETGPQT